MRVLPCAHLRKYRKSSISVVCGAGGCGRVPLLILKQREEKKRMVEQWLEGHLRKRGDTPEERPKLIRLAGFAGIAANAVFAAVKLVVGTVANSVSIVSDAVNNLADALSSVITLAGLKLSERPPDYKHPLGYGRIEYISGMIVSVLVLMTGIEFFKTSAARIAHPEAVFFSTAQLVVLAVTIAGKWVLSRFNIVVGKRTDSDSLIASGMDAKMDVAASIVTVAAALVSKFTGWSIDGYVGILLSLFILYTGVDLVRGTLSSIIGERPEKPLAEGIKAEVLKYPPVLGAYDLILHNYGPATRLGSLNLEIPDTETVEKTYAAMNAAQRDVYRKFGIYLTFGLYSVNTYDRKVVEARETVKKLVLSIPGAISMHAFNYDEERNAMRFDVVVDFKVRDFPAFRAKAVEKIRRVYPDANVSVNVDLDYA